MIKLVIFDLDGTLVDSKTDITNALNFAVEPLELEKLTIEKTVSLVGEGVTRLIEKVIGADRAGLAPEVLNRFIDYYSKHLTDFTRPYPGVRETLEKLSFCKRAVISNKRESLSKRLLEELGLLGCFDIVYGSDSAGEKKPSPKPLLRMLEHFSVSPDEAVIVGDSNFDIEAGKAAGVRTVGVSYGYRDVSFLRDADYIIDDISALIPILNELGKSRSAFIRA
ncbi:MAG: HAD-IA family hydrolase [Nitrospirae bacterium]|nr:HAD-IA family hydrolase [Nitrospirota bacterium]